MDNQIDWQDIWWDITDWLEDWAVLFLPLVFIGLIAWFLVRGFGGTEVGCGYGNIIDSTYRTSTRETNTVTTINTDGDIGVGLITTGDPEKRAFVVEFPDRFEQFDVSVDAFYRYDIGDRVECYTWEDGGFLKGRKIR